MADSARIDDHLWQKVLTWYHAKGRHFFPWRNERTPWRVLLAESLLRRTRATAASRVFSRLVAEFHGPEDVIQDQSSFADETKSLGLASRSSLFAKACEVICDQFGGTVPKEGDELINLPGVGHYSRDAILNFGFNEPRYLIDTNTIRLISRFTGEKIDQTQHRSKKVRTAVGIALGPEAQMTADRNFALLDLAALICCPSSPKCDECPLSRACNHAQADLQDRKNSNPKNGTGLRSTALKNMTTNPWKRS